MNDDYKRYCTPRDSLEFRQLAETVSVFAERALKVAPGSSPKFSRKDFDEMSKLGLTAAAVSEKFGGSALSTDQIAGIIFSLARNQLGPAIYLSVHLMVSRLIENFAQEKQFDDQLRRLASGTALGAFALTEATAGSDAAALRTKAVKDGNEYILNGEKIYITSSGHADLYLVFARTGDETKDGISAFVLDSKTPGLQCGPSEEKMGCEGSPIATVTLNDVRVPSNVRLGEEGLGYKIALSGLNTGRINIAAAACGVASRSLELSVQYSHDRKQFGKAIGEFQGIQFILADMYMKLKSALTLTRDAAQAVDAGERAFLQASAAKCFATDAAMHVTTDGVQIFGGAGYLRHYEVERLMRDAKMLQIVEGTNQIQRLVIARELERK